MTRAGPARAPSSSARRPGIVRPSVGPTKWCPTTVPNCLPYRLLWSFQSVSVKDPGPRPARSVLNHRHDRRAGRILDRVRILDGDIFSDIARDFVASSAEKWTKLPTESIAWVSRTWQNFQKKFSEERFTDPNANVEGTPLSPHDLFLRVVFNSPNLVYEL